MSSSLPITPTQIAEAAIEAVEAGAAIVHLHARDPKDGRPTPDPNVFMQFLPRIREQTDAIINITTGGSTAMTLEERLAAPLRAEPEMASLNMGSMNFGTYHLAAGIQEWKFGWEQPYLEATRGVIFRNTFADIEMIFRQLGEGCGTRFEFECYDVGHLYSLAHFLDRGIFRPPLFVQTVLGVLGGIGPDPSNLVHLKAVADRLFGNDYVWSILAAGRHQMSLVTMGAIMGGNARVGLEDSLWIGRGQMAQSNAAQVRKVRSILEALSFEIASPCETREMLQLKGRDMVKF